MPTKHRRRSHREDEQHDSSSVTQQERTKGVRHDNDNEDNDDDDVSRSSSSGGSSEDDKDDSRRSRDGKRKRTKSRRKGDHPKSKKKKSKRHKSSRHRKPRDLDDDDDGSSSSYDEEEEDDDDNDDDIKNIKKHKKKKDKKKKKKKTRHRRERSEPTDQDPRATIRTNTTMESRDHILTQALCHLFSQRPVFAQELPILLIRLVGGSTFDLRQMGDHVASSALARVLECLQDFGVQQKQGEWLFQSPPGRRDERILLRIIRAQLDQVGVTMQAVAVHESELKEAAKNVPLVPPTDDKAKTPNRQDPLVEKVKDLTSAVVLKYQDKESDLGSQLAGLCHAISQGESIFVDGLPDEQLKVALEEIFLACGLEKSEMAEDDSDEEGGPDKETTKGYGLPEHESTDIIQLRLAAVMEACRNPKRRALGPMRPTEQEVTMEYSSDADEGPFLPGHEKRPRGPVLPSHILKAQSEHRELELKATVAGIEIPKMTGGREEWMVVPGNYDFLSTIKSGQPLKSRGFENKKNRGDDKVLAPVHPAVQAEMDAIMQAHQDSRGPSLFDQHRAAKQEERKSAATTTQAWTWNRESDLDAGRKVDKEALHMVLGGAADNLKTKFHGGFD